MATWNKFNGFSQDVLNGVHNWSADTFKVILTNTLPVATNENYADVSAAELANGNGYTTGGLATTVTGDTDSAGTASITLSNAVLTATGAVGPFRYAILQNSTHGKLVSWFDYGSSVTVSFSGETFTVAFASPAFTLV